MKWAVDSFLRGGMITLRELAYYDLYARTNGKVHRHVLHRVATENGVLLDLIDVTYRIDLNTKWPGKIQ